MYSAIFYHVAHFCNTIDQQMIPTQQGMMLETTMALEQGIKTFVLLLARLEK